MKDFMTFASIMEVWPQIDQLSFNGHAGSKDWGQTSTDAQSTHRNNQRSKVDSETGEMSEAAF